MTSPLILTLFLATISAFIAFRLSDRAFSPIKTVFTNIKNHQAAMPALLILAILLFVFKSFSSSIALITGVLIFSVATYFLEAINRDATNDSLYNLLCSAVSIIILSITRSNISDNYVFIGFIIASALIYWFKHKSKEHNEIFFKNFFINAMSVLGAGYFFAGSEATALFPLLISAIGCTSMLISIFVATHYPYKKPQQMFTVATIAFILLSATAAAKFIPFNPHLIALCTFIGVTSAYTLLRTQHTLLKTFIVPIILLLSYATSGYYGIVIALIAFNALTTNILLLSNNEGHKNAVQKTSIILLFLLALRSVSAANHSILFEIGDPYLIVGIILSVIFEQEFTEHANQLLSHPKLNLLTPLIPLILFVVITALLGKTHGMGLIFGLITGLTLNSAIFSKTETETNRHLPLTYLSISVIFLLVLVITK